ncbi:MULTISPECIES: hypothetical protein [Bradyrhizobium]|uniref:hypothetical protein n=1 Tax=Bradyrhizobium TaxID=374 RepID=UPI000413D168|nr:MULTISPECIES: hypothetical protein [Bradyrhizobium]QOG19037.1 hypothetical protein FOM02_18505 [Bradyrhizobium sp. SEMIA]UFW48495.1 hypothetical protein BaraCB756_40630 [Bradyrhizobium arachidis]
MSVEPIGVLTVLLGLLCLPLGQRVTFSVLICTTLFGAAAAILVGGANIQPGHLFLAFVFAMALASRRETAAAVRAVSFGQPGFWLLCLVVYGIGSAFLLPRLLAGGTQIVPLGASEYANTGTTVPLGPVSSNFTQSIYMIANLTCFGMTVAIGSSHGGFRTIVTALLCYSAGNVLLAMLDVATYATGTQALLSFMRNAQYAMHFDDEVNGAKRIVGSYPEASAFARATLGAVAFTGTLFLFGRNATLTGLLAAASLALVILSTSSTGLAGAPLVLLILYISMLRRTGFDSARPFSSAAALCAPVLLITLILAVLLDERASEIVQRYADTVILNKSSSTSAIERSSWNTYAMQNFFDSLGLGVGLGTVRTSSLPIALLSNVGIPGTMFYWLFVMSALFGQRNAPHTFEADACIAARTGCLALMIGDTLAAPTVEQGLLFYALAGLACSAPRDQLAPILLAPSPASGANV